MTETSHLRHLIKTLTTTTPLHIPYTPTEPKRASVGILLRIKNNTIPLDTLLSTNTLIQLEIVYIRRANNPKDRWSGHMAFPGGKVEVGEADQTACEREWIEEVGIDLQQFKYLGRLDDREVKAPASTRRSMVLCSFVYLQVIDTPLPFQLNTNEIESVYWVPCEYLVGSDTIWESIPFDISRQLSHRLPSFCKPILTAFFGRVLFYGIHAPIEHRVTLEKVTTAYEEGYRFPIWGLTLWMTSDLLNAMGLGKIVQKGGPRYSAIDVDFYITLLSGKKRTLETFLLRD